MRNYDLTRLSPEQIEKLWGFFENEEGTHTVARVEYDPDADDLYQFGEVVFVYESEADALKVCQTHNAIVCPYMCEHGLLDGDWCEACNEAYKAAVVDPENAK